MTGLILGGADCLWRDLHAFDALRLTVDHVIAVNDAGYAYPHRIDHWTSLHPGKFPVWEPQRTGNRDYIRWSNKDSPYVDRRCHAWGSGSSGLLAVSLAIDVLGCDEVWLCGVPMQEAPHWFGGALWTGWRAHRKAWVKNVERMRGKCWSLSGWTRELLGEYPTVDESRDAA